MLLEIKFLVLLLELECLPDFLIDLLGILQLPECFLHFLFSLGPLHLFHKAVTGCLLEFALPVLTFFHYLGMFVPFLEVCVMNDRFLKLLLFLPFLLPFLLFPLDP